MGDANLKAVSNAFFDAATTLAAVKVDTFLISKNPVTGDLRIAFCERFSDTIVKPRTSVFISADDAKTLAGMLQEKYLTPDGEAQKLNG